MDIADKSVPITVQIGDDHRDAIGQIQKTIRHEYSTGLHHSKIDAPKYTTKGMDRLGET